MFALNLENVNFLFILVTGKLYLIHEHMACEKLDVGISDPGSETEVMGYLFGILDGLEVVHSFGVCFI